MQSKLVAESAGQRIFVIILEPGEEAFSTFDFAVKEQFSQCEVPSALGDIAIDDSGKPSLHVHVVLGLSDGSIRGGHLLEGFVRATIEVSLVETPARSAGCGRIRTRRRATRRWGSCPGYAGLRLLSTLPGPRLRLPGRKAGLSRGRDLSRLHPCPIGLPDGPFGRDPGGRVHRRLQETQPDLRDSVRDIDLQRCHEHDAAGTADAARHLCDGGTGR